MKKLYLVTVPVLISAIIFLSVFSFDYSERKNISVNAESDNGLPTIIIDPGHGGFDGGATTSEGYPEKHINLNISKYLFNLFSISGYDVIITRDSDISLESDGLSTIREKKTSDIHNRMKFMEENPDSIFISIHQNHYSVSKYWGAQVFYSPNYSEESGSIAESVQETIVQFLQEDNTRTVKECGTSVYLIYKAVVPAVLVECGFLSNEQEATLLMTDEYQKKISYAIYIGIEKYLLRS